MSSVLVTRVYSSIPIFYLVNFEILEHFGNFRAVYKEKLFVTRKGKKVIKCCLVSEKERLWTI